MKRLVVIAAIVLLLAGGSLAGLYLFMPGMLGLPEPPKPEEVAADLPPPPPTKPPTVAMETVSVPVMLDGKPQRQIHFSITLITTAEAQAKVAEDLPRLRNAVISFAYGFFPEYFASTPKMDLARLKVTLLKLAQRTLGDGIEDVLIQSYIEM